MTKKEISEILAATDYFYKKTGRKTGLFNFASFTKKSFGILMVEPT